VTRVTADETSVRVMGSPREVTYHLNMQVERSRSGSRISHAAHHVFPLPFRKGKHEGGRKKRSARREKPPGGGGSLFSSREVTDRLNMQVKPSCSASRSFPAAYHVLPTDDPVRALNFLREAAGLQPLSDEHDDQGG